MIVFLFIESIYFYALPLLPTASSLLFYSLLKLAAANICIHRLAAMVGIPVGVLLKIQFYFSVYKDLKVMVLIWLKARFMYGFICAPYFDLMDFEESLGKDLDLGCCHYPVKYL